MGARSASHERASSRHAHVLAPEALSGELVSRRADQYTSRPRLPDSCSHRESALTAYDRPREMFSQFAFSASHSLNEARPWNARLAGAWVEHVVMRGARKECPRHRYGGPFMFRLKRWRDALATPAPQSLCSSLCIIRCFIG